MISSQKFKLEDRRVNYHLNNQSINVYFIFMLSNE